MSEQVDPFVKQALTKLLNPTGSFSISTFDEICTILNVIPPPGHRNRLRLMHCVNYRDMPEDLRQELGRLIYETLNSPGFQIEIRRASIGAGKVRAITGQAQGDR